jgi:hypothetical protein
VAGSALACPNFQRGATDAASCDLDGRPSLKTLLGSQFLDWRPEAIGHPKLSAWAHRFFIRVALWSDLNVTQ